MLNTTHGREQRYQPPCCSETRPADQREDYSENLTQMFFRQRPHIAAKFDDVQEVTNYSECFHCNALTSHDELVKCDDVWICEKCEAEITDICPICEKDCQWHSKDFRRFVRAEMGVN